MYVPISDLPKTWARGLAGDPGQVLTDTIAQSKERLSFASLFTVALFAGAGYLILNSGRRR
jgi:hypothetical protein